MNKLISILTLLILLVPGILKAQDASTQKPTTEYPILENKLKKSDEQKEDPKKNVNPKFWLSRADLMMDIYNVDRKYIEGQALVSIKFYYGEPKEIKSEEKDGKLYETYVYDRVNVIFENGNLYNYVTTQPVGQNVLTEALASLKKAQELDTDGKLNKKIGEAYSSLSELFVHKGGRDYFYDQDTKSAFDNFTAALDINEIVSAPIDTSLMFNCGLIAHQNNMTDESIKYFSKVLEYNYPNPKSYVFIKQSYFTKGDTAKGMDYLKEGFEKFPDSQDILIEFINYYLITGKSGEALEYIKLAQEKDPTNISLIFAEATLYDKEGNTDKAIETYKGAVELDPEFFDAYFNLGVVYYYYAQDFYEKAAAPSNTNAEFKAITEKGDEQLKKATEPLEKCVSLYESKELTAAEKDTLKIVYETLKSIYYRFKMTEEYDEVKTKLESME
ncbi:MAG: tetratricopeptide repeat protein [Bacteroidales bacterium]|nr:tetratricopeptide repeat protein [Bacteroidales bacterium]MBN2820228.1 tetratricopeptide repeat protein [Bacteroidales bacterium]